MGVWGAGDKISVKQSCMQNWGSRLLDTSSHIQFFTGNQCKLMAQWLRQFPVSQATWVWFYCFASGELECWPGPALAQCPHVQAWHIHRDYSYCRTLELTDHQVSGFLFPDFSKTQKKQTPHQRHFEGSCPCMPRTKWCTGGQKLFILVSMSSLIENCGSCPENPEQCPPKQKWIKNRTIKLLV